MSQPPSLLLWSNALRVVGDDGVLLGEAHKAARVSRRAMRTMLQMPQWFVTEPGRGSRGGHIVHLSDDGSSGLDAGYKRFEVVEGAWRDRFDGNAVDRLRSSLCHVVSGLPLELPWYPVPYGPADGSVDGGLGRPGHGADWPVLVRDGESGDAVSSLPLSALLSQIFLAFAMDVEDASNASMLSLVAKLALITAHGVPLEILPQGFAWPGDLPTLGLAVVEPDPSRPRKKLIRLTREGVAMRAEMESHVAAVEADWRARYGAPTIDSLRTALAVVVRELDPTVPDYILVMFIGGLGFVVAP
jgi:hypothetical protein